MNVDIHGTPIYFTIDLFGGIPITETLVVTWVIMILLTGLCIWLTHGLKVWNISKRQAVAEKIVLLAENFIISNMGEQSDGTFPLSRRFLPCPFAPACRLWWGCSRRRRRCPQSWPGR